MAEDGEGRLRRWSRRKAAARVASPDDSEIAGDPRNADAPEPLAALSTDGTSAGEIVDPTGTVPDGPPDDDVVPEDLPDVESLDKDSDFSVFMREDVPQKIRNMALRKLWLSDPAFNITDGMVEYGEDFTIVSPMLGSIYEVGKGYLTEEDEVDDAEAEVDDAEVEDGEDDGEAVVAAEDATPADENLEDDRPVATGADDAVADTESNAMKQAPQAEIADKAGKKGPPDD